MFLDLNKPAQLCQLSPFPYPPTLINFILSIMRLPLFSAALFSAAIVQSIPQCRLESEWAQDENSASYVNDQVSNGGINADPLDDLIENGFDAPYKLPSNSLADIPPINSPKAIPDEAPPPCAEPGRTIPSCCTGKKTHQIPAPEGVLAIDHCSIRMSFLASFSPSVYWRKL